MTEMMKKKRRKVWKILCVFFFLCILVIYVPERIQADGEELVLQIECGYDGYGKFGRNIPFSAEIISGGSFQGVLRIIVPANDGKENYAYEYPVSVEEGVPLTVRGEIPLISNYTSVSFQVLSGKGRVLARQDTAVKISGRELTELFVGVLSENPDAAAAFHSVNIGEYTDSSFPYVKTRAFALEAEDIENIHYGLDCLDIIVLDRYVSERLTETQKKALNRWVSEGGALIAEVSGGYYIFPEEIYPVTEEIEARPYLWVQTQNVKNGRVGYFNLRVADMDLMEFAVDNNAIPGSVISKVCSAEIITQIIENDHYYNGEEAYSAVTSLLDTAMGRKLPKISVYFAVILIYLVLAGPVVFYVLRKKDKAGLTGAAVSGLAVLFSVLIYLMGTTTRFQEPVIRYASVWTLDGKTVSELTYIDTKAPTSNSYQLKINPRYFLQPVSADSYYYYETVDEETVLNDYKIELYHGEEATAITMRQSAPFESQYFRLEKEQENQDLTGLRAELKYFNETLSGRIYNETKEDLENAVLVLRNSIYMLGDIKAGDSADIRTAEKLCFYPDTCDAAAEEITGFSSVNYQIDSENREYAVLSQKTKLLEYYLKQVDPSDGTNAVLLGFLTSGTSDSFLADKEYSTYGATLLNKRVSLDNTSGGLIYQNLTADEINNIDDDISYHEATGSTYSSSIRLEYNLGNKEQLRAVRFAPVEVDERNPDYQSFRGEVYFYNPLTLAYEQVDLDRKNFWISDLEKYLLGRDGQCTLIVQYTSDRTDTEQYKEIVLPLVSVIRKK